MRDSGFARVHRGALLPVLLGFLIAPVVAIGCGGDETAPLVRGEAPTLGDRAGAGASGEPGPTATAGIPPTAVHAEWTTEDVLNFSEFALYWVGEEFQGLPLSRVIHHVSPQSVEFPEDVVIFIYGTCTPAPGMDGCSPPLAIRVEPYCYAPPESISPEASQSGMMKVRGNADARAVSDGLRMWTGNVSVRIDDDTRATDLEMVAANALVSPNGLGPTSSEEPLPPPDGDCSDFELAEPPSESQ